MRRTCATCGTEIQNHVPYEMIDGEPRCVGCADAEYACPAGFLVYDDERPDSLGRRAFSLYWNSEKRRRGQCFFTQPERFLDRWEVVASREEAERRLDQKGKQTKTANLRVWRTILGNLGFGLGFSKDAHVYADLDQYADRGADLRSISGDFEPLADAAKTAAEHDARVVDVYVYAIDFNHYGPNYKTLVENVLLVLDADGIWTRATPRPTDAI